MLTCCNFLFQLLIQCHVHVHNHAVVNIIMLIVALQPHIDTLTGATNGKCFCFLCQHNIVCANDMGSMAN